MDTLTFPMFGGESGKSIILTAVKKAPSIIIRYGDFFRICFSHIFLWMQAKNNTFY
jgi:hypothetical protein